MSKNKFKVDLSVRSQQIAETQEKQEFTIITEAELTETEDSYFLIFEQSENLETEQAKSLDKINLEETKFSLKIQKNLEKITLRRFGASSYALDFINHELTYNYVNTNYGRLELIYRTNRISQEKNTEKDLAIKLDYDLMNGDSVLAKSILNITFSKNDN